MGPLCVGFPHRTSLCISLLSHSVCCECCVLSGRGVCDELIAHPEEYYQLWCIIASDLKISEMSRPWPTGGLLHQIQTKNSLMIYPALTNYLQTSPGRCYYLFCFLTHWNTQSSVRRWAIEANAVNSSFVSRWHNMSYTVWKLKKRSIEWYIIQIVSVVRL